MDCNGIRSVARCYFLVRLTNRIGAPILFFILSGVVTLYCVLGITLELKTSPAQTSFSAMLTAFQFPWLPLSPVLRVVVGTHMI